MGICGPAASSTEPVRCRRPRGAASSRSPPRSPITFRRNTVGAGRDTDRPRLGARSESCPLPELAGLLALGNQVAATRCLIAKHRAGRAMTTVSLRYRP